MFSYERVRLVGGLVICVRWIWCGRYCWHFSCLFVRMSVWSMACWLCVSFVFVFCWFLHFVRIMVSVEMQLRPRGVMVDGVLVQCVSFVCRSLGISFVCLYVCLCGLWLQICMSLVVCWLFLKWYVDSREVLCFTSTFI